MISLFSWITEHTIDMELFSVRGIFARLVSHFRRKAEILRPSASLPYFVLLVGSITAVFDQALVTRVLQLSSAAAPRFQSCRYGRCLQSL